MERSQQMTERCSGKTLCNSHGGRHVPARRPQETALKRAETGHFATRWAFVRRLHDVQTAPAGARNFGLKIQPNVYEDIVPSHGPPGGTICPETGCATRAERLAIR
jgi:hypothetical protein